MRWINWRMTELIVCIVLAMCLVQSIKTGDTKAAWWHGAGTLVFLVGFLTGSREAAQSKLHRVMMYVTWPVLVVLVAQMLLK